MFKRFFTQIDDFGNLVDQDGHVINRNDGRGNNTAEARDRERFINEQHRQLNRLHLPKKDDR